MDNHVNDNISPLLWSLLPDASNSSLIILVGILPGPQEQSDLKSLILLPHQIIPAGKRNLDSGLEELLVDFWSCFVAYPGMYIMISVYSFIYLSLSKFLYSTKIHCSFDTFKSANYVIFS